MRVLRVIGALYPEFGGPSESSVNACIASQRHGVHNTLVFAAAATAEHAVQPTEEKLRSEGVVVRRFRTVPLIPFYARRWSISPRLCCWLIQNAGRFDVVHIHQTWGLAQVAALAAAGVWKRPCVVTPHESLTNYDIDREKRLVKSLLKRWYLSAAAHVEVASPLEADDSVPRRHRAKARIVPHPLAAAHRSPLSAPRHGGDEALTVGFLGRLHPKKNLDVLIRAIALAPEGTRLRVAGDGPTRLKRILLSCASVTGVASQVEWLGFVAHDNKAAFLRSLDVLVLASEYECFGVAAAEAMSHGVPVVVSGKTGIASIVAEYECGIVVAPTECDIATALQRLAVDRDLARRLGSQGPVAVESEMSMEVFGARAASRYAKLVSTFVPPQNDSASEDLQAE